MRRVTRRQRGTPPRPTDRDLNCWKRLLKRASLASGDPAGDPLSFVKAAEKAGRAVPPVGHQGLDSPFVALVRMGKGWAATPRNERTDLAPELRRLVRACLAILSSGEPQPRLPYADDL